METIEHIRYNRLVHRGGALLHLFDVGQLKLIGRIAASLPPDDFSLLYPFSFADIHLGAHQNLGTVFASLTETEQCRVLDVAIELSREDETKAMLSVSHESGAVCLLSLGKQTSTLIDRATHYLASPLLITMVDPVLEPDVHQVLQHSGMALDQGEWETEACCICIAACSEEFFAEHIFTFPLTARFSLTWGPTKDRYGRLVPTYLHEATGHSPR